MHHTSIRWMLHGLNTEGKKRIRIKWRCFCKQWTQLRMFCERAEEKVFTSAAVISIKQQNRNVTISHGNCQLGPNWISLILNRGEKYKSEHVQCFTVGPFVFTFQTTFNSFHTTRNTPSQYGLMLSFQASYLENIQCELIVEFINYISMKPLKIRKKQEQNRKLNIVWNLSSRHIG